MIWIFPESFLGGNWWADLICVLFPLQYLKFFVDFFFLGVVVFVVGSFCSIHDSA